MNKHQTFNNIKYGKLINKINNIITDVDIRSDMIKFIANVPGTLKHPYIIILHFSNAFLLSYNGSLYFEHITDISKSINELSYTKISFDGKNNFKFLIWGILDGDKIPSKWITIIDWASINDIEHYVDIYPNYFLNINKIQEY